MSRFRTFQPVSLRLETSHIEHLKQLAREVAVVQRKDINLTDLIRDLVEEFYPVPETSDAEEWQKNDIIARAKKREERERTICSGETYTTTTGSTAISITTTFPNGTQSVQCFNDPSKLSVDKNEPKAESAEAEDSSDDAAEG